MELRYATARAARGWAEVASAASPFLVCSEASVRHEMEHHPGTLARFVVVEDGKVLGITRVRSGTEPRVMFHVEPEHQGRGVGRLLFERVRRLVAGAAMAGIVNGDEHSTSVARHWGFDLTREHAVSVLDPHLVRPAGPTPAGLVVVPLEKAGVEAVWECHQSAAGDDPSGLTRQIALDEFATTQWRDPDHRPGLGRAVLHADEVLAYSSVTVAGDRAWSSMTATRPEHRGRGLATLAKRHGLRALAEAGVTHCWTGNDGANAAMLTVNDALGYRRTATTWGARRPGG